MTDHQEVVLDRMVQAVKHEVEECGSIDLLLLTGDLVWGNDPRATLDVDQQWVTAGDFVSELMNASGDISADNVFVAPGNHDLRREAWGMMQRDFLRSADAKKFEAARNDAMTWEPLALAFAEFDEFLAGLSLPGAGSFSTLGHFAATRTIDDIEVGIAVGNTAFGAFDESDRNSLHFGTSQTESLVKATCDSELRLLLTHHPLTWLREDTERMLDLRIRSEFDVHFHGHEHRIRVSDTGQLLRLEGGALYDHEGLVENYFSVLSLDHRTQTSGLRAWELTEGSGHRWRPCTQWGFENNGHYGNLNALHVYGASARSDSREAQPPLVVTSAKEQISLKALVGHLDQRYGLRWQTGDFREDGSAPAVFWPVRLREPTIIHAVQAFVAAGLQDRGAQVSLVVDDLGNTGIKGTNGFESKLRGWMDFAIPGQGSGISVTALSDLLAEPTAAAPGWAVVRNWWSIPNETISNVFQVSKLLSDSIDLAAVVERSPRRLMSPPMVWAGLSITYPPDCERSVITLCGDDERLLWETWTKYCDDAQRLPTAHLFLPSLGGADGSPIHMAEDSMSWKDRVELKSFLKESRRRDNYQALAWLSRMCVDLPEDLRGAIPRELVTTEDHLADPERLDALEQALAEIVDV